MSKFNNQTSQCFKSNFSLFKKIINLILLFDQTINSINYADAVYENNLIDRKFTYEKTLFIKNNTVI